MRLPVTKRWTAAIATISVVAAVFAAIWLTRPAQVVVSNQETGQVYYQTEAYDGLRIELSWVHSVEKEPWIEIYEIEGEDVVLREIVLEAYGAGVPNDLGGVTHNENGVVHTSGLDKHEPYLHWVHSHNTEHQVIVGDHVIPTTAIEHHAFVELAVEDN